jgi:phosphatidylserine/phosphatidylglycerophosphate/cardiolipin synthase-like enzyme
MRSGVVASVLRLVTCRIRRAVAIVALAAAAFTGTASPARALDRLCDPSHEDCRAILLTYIRNETVGIDVGFWFMEDARYTAELARRLEAGVPVRVIMDLRANDINVHNPQRLAELAAAGIPMRHRSGTGIMHYKMMLFSGQGIVQFGGANFSADAWVFNGLTPYVNYVDEAIYFTDNASLVHSFMTKFDDLWTNTTAYADYANVPLPLARHYPTYTKDPLLNFPPVEPYANRAVGRYNQENQKIDVIMYRITDRRHTDAMIAAKNRGVTVRVISDPQQYRALSKLWVSWNIDRMYMAGIPIKMRAHAGLNHQKLVLLYGQMMSIFGSSNWTSSSDAEQEEHNCFCTDTAMFQWFTDMFERKWNNGAGVLENTAFVPLPPDKPANPSPASGATGTVTSMTLKWYAGPWAHKYNIYFGTTTTPPLVVGDVELGPSESTTQLKSYTIAAPLTPGTTYYWRVTSKTMANLSVTSDLWSFTTSGAVPPPPTGGSAGPGDIVLYAARASVKTGKWTVTPDSSAAGGTRMTNPNLGVPKLMAPLASPSSYFEMTFTAEAGKPYHLWMRGKAENNAYSNDSVYAQFSDSVDASGAALWQIGTTSGTEVNLEDCSGCGVADWGWQDNGWGIGVLGPHVYFATTGVHTLRVQVREDGLSIDQIVLSLGPFLSLSPGALKNDVRILVEQDGGPPPPPPAGLVDVVLYASQAPIVAGAWVVTADPSAASGARLRNPNLNGAKITTPSAAPANFFEMTFNAEAGQPYRLWVRAQAESNYWANDSVFVQFSGAVAQNGAALYGIGTTAAAEVNLEEGPSAGVSGWGWQDNGYGVGVLGPLVYFATTGTQTIRIQQREDGMSVDQIVLSPSRFLNGAPGLHKNDETILPKP